MSLKALREILKDTDPSQLPYGLAACLAGNRQAITANKAAFGHCDENNRPQPIPPAATLPTTTPDPTATLPAKAILPAATPDPKVYHATSSSPHLSDSQTGKNPSPTPQQATVPGTELHMAPSERLQPDLSLQVCPNVADTHQPTATRTNWEPHLLFPELRATTSQSLKRPLVTTRTNSKKTTKPTQPAAPTLLRRTARGKINKKKTMPHGARNNLEAQDFIDIPLQVAEGQHILHLIGAGHLTIPENLIAEAAQLPSDMPHC